MTLAPIRLAAALMMLAGVTVACGGSQGIDDGAALAEIRPADDGGDAADGDRKRSTVEVTGDRSADRPRVVVPDSWGSEIDELYGRYWLYWDAFAAAFGPPFADPEHATLRSLSSPENWASLQVQLSGFAADGLVLVLPDETRPRHSLRLPTAALLERREGAEVILQDCWVDDFIQQTVDGRLVAAADETRLMNVVMRVIDGQWRVHGVTRSSADADGVDACADSASQS